MHPAAQLVGVRAALGLPRAGLVSLLGREPSLDLPEHLVVDQRRVHDRRGIDPGVRVVPPHPGLVAEGDVIDADEDLVFALLVPDLPTGVAGVGQYRAHRRFRPGDAAAVPVALRVIGRRAGNPVRGQPLRDHVQAPSARVLAEDPKHDRGCDGIGFQDVQPAALGRLGRVRVRTGVDDAVAVRWPTAEESPLGPGLRGHRGPHPDLDTAPFALTHPAEHRHDQIVGFAGRVDRPADLRHPQRHPVVFEQREGQAELVAVEGPVRFADDDRVEPTPRVFQRVQ